MEEARLENWTRFTLLAEGTDVGSPLKPNYVFRGQPDSKYGLQPSLLRHLKRLNVHEERAIEIEKLALEEFRGQVHLHIGPNIFTTTTDVVSWWTLMQHHGAPTRMLDWSTSIYVAAYFAAISCPDADGAIWLVHLHSVEKAMKAMYSDIADLPRDASGMQRRFQTPNAPRAINFAGRINRSDRMIAQQGLFSISPSILADHGEVLDGLFSGERERFHFMKIILPASLKPQFLRRLRAMNITANSLFPGLDGLARSVSEMLLLSDVG